MAATKNSQKKTGKQSKTKSAKASASQQIVLLVSTRKGAWLFQSDAKRKKWKLNGPHFLGQIINHMVLDPRDGRTLLAAASTGHLGPTMFRSTSLGRKWAEVSRPPAFAMSDRKSVV